MKQYGGRPEALTLAWRLAAFFDLSAGSRSVSRLRRKGNVDAAPFRRVSPIRRLGIVQGIAPYWFSRFAARVRPIASLPVGTAIENFIPIFLEAKKALE